MQIRLYSPFNERIGKNLVEFNLEGEITVSQFSKRLVDQFPIFKTFLTGDKSYDILNSIFFVARGGILFGPEDIVKDEEELEVIPYMDGG